MSLHDYVEAEYRIFPLWGLDNKGNCACGDPQCKAKLKHPRISNWQHSPCWSDEQLEVMEASGQFDSGFGVCVDGQLVIDIDPRNGGFESYDKLKKETDTDYEKKANFVVETGGGGLHIYLALSEPVALVSNLKSYPGIDFKSSGYVVGAGSLHASGSTYERKKGFPSDVNEAPSVLIDLLKKPDRIRASVGADFIDVSEREMTDMLAFISPDCPYDDWINVGMGLHDATQGGGVRVWDQWSCKGSNYDSDNIDRHWQSFGKCANPVTLGTVIHLASQGGWTQPVTFELPKEEIGKAEGYPFPIDTVDLLRPTGLVGQVAEWIDSQCRYPRESLSVAAAINTVGNIGGLRHSDEYNDITANTLILCVAASGTGKEAVQQAQADIMRAAGVSSAVHGAIKSEQEITRNILRHQPAYYIIDELGYLLQKIENARKKGGASYLDGIIAGIMSIYTKANGFYLIGGDMKDDMKKEMFSELSKLESKLDKGIENEKLKDQTHKRIDYLFKTAIPSIDNGIEDPFLSMIGFTTPVTFDDLVTGEQATNGFIGRCLLIREHETNPKRRRGFKKKELNAGLVAVLQNLYKGGVTPYDNTERVEWLDSKSVVHTTDSAAEMLELAADWFEEEAERQKALTGLEAIVRRSYELMAKVSFVLAMGGRLREPEHVRWAFALVVKDMREKLRLAQTNILSASNNVKDSSTVLRNKIIDIVGGDDGERMSVIKRRVGTKFSGEDIEQMIMVMISNGVIVEDKKDTGRRPSVRYVVVK